METTPLDFRPEPVEARVEALGQGAPPAVVLRRLARRDDLTCLHGRWAGGSVLVGWRPRHEVVGGDPFATLALLPEVVAADPSCVVGGGWFGYLGYALAEALAPRSFPSPPPRRLPASVLRYYDCLLRWDPGLETWFFESLWSRAADERLAHRLREAAALVSAGDAPERPFRLGAFVGPDPEAHARAVEEVVHRIHSGDLFQANVCTRFSGSLRGSPVTMFAAGISAFSPSRAALVQGSWGTVVSFSPELFVERDGDMIVCAPIKGTRPRSPEPLLDEEQAASLAASRKDAAENLMIVDLMRNDLSRVAEMGSVLASDLLAVEPHASVWHLVSYVRARLAPDLSTGSVLRSLFPPGSVTGAPKLAAMATCAAVETEPREVYTGCIGYASPLRRDSWSVAIRTFEVHGSDAWIGTGGGVTADSDPAEEWDECLAKVGPLVERLGGSLSAEPFAGPSRRRPEEVTDVALALDGVVVDREAHRRRLLAACATALRAAPAVELRAPGPGSVLLTTSVRPGPHGLVVSSTAEPAPSLDLHRPLRLVPVVGTRRDERPTPGGRLGAEDVPLLLDARRQVLGTARGAIFLVAAGTLVTPPTAGRLPRDVARRRLALLATSLGLEVRFRPVSLDDLASADAAVVAGSPAGVRPVVEVVGHVAFDPSPLVERLRDAYEDWIAGEVAGQRAVSAFRRSLTAAPVRPRLRADSRAAPGRRVLVVDNYDSFTYNLVHALAAEGAEIAVMVNDDPRPVRPDHFDALVVSPGPGSPETAGRSLELVDAFARAGRPVLGVCLGHQCIAALFGLPVEPASWPCHGSASRIWHDGTGLFAGLPQGFAAGRYHSLCVRAGVDAPVRVTAVSDDDVVMAIAHEALPIHGLQFHPESVLTTVGRTLLRNYLLLAPARLPITGEDPRLARAESRASRTSRARR